MCATTIGHAACVTSVAQHLQGFVIVRGHPGCIPGFRVDIDLAREIGIDASAEEYCAQQLLFSVYYFRHAAYISIFCISQCVSRVTISLRCFNDAGSELSVVIRLGHGFQLSTSFGTHPLQDVVVYLYTNFPCSRPPCVSSFG